jgi:hypothetical protein
MRQEMTECVQIQESYHKYPECEDEWETIYHRSPIKDTEQEKNQ